MGLSAYTMERQICGIMPSLEAANLQENPGYNAGILCQLNQSLTLHAEVARESNIIRREELNRLKVKDDKEKDKVVARIYPSVVNMVKMAASEDGERQAADIPKTLQKHLELLKRWNGQA